MTATTAPRAEVPSHVPDAVAPPPGNPRFPLLDSLRAIAVLSILVFHASGTRDPGLSGDVLTRLDVGVAIFFVLSGFLLYRPYVNNRVLGAPAVGIGSYARRRALRILPAYWVALTVLAIWPGLSGVFGDRWWSYYGLLQVYDFDTTVQGLGVAWSLCIEVSFYVLLPFYALLVTAALARRTLRIQVRAELAVLGVLAVASLALRYYLREDKPLSPALHTLPTHVWWFAVGMGLAVLSVLVQAEKPVPSLLSWLGKHPTLCWVLGAGAFAGVCLIPPLLHDTADGGVFGFIDGPEDLIINALYGVVAGLLVLPGVFSARNAGVPGRVLSWRPLAWAGLVSYAVFLYQVPVIQQLQKHGVDDWLGGHLQLLTLSGVAAAVTIAIAAVSYYAIERPLLRFKDPRRRGAAPRARGSTEVAAAPRGR